MTNKTKKTPELNTGLSNQTKKGDEDRSRMKLLDFWMIVESGKESTRNRFTIYGVRPRIMLDRDMLPVIEMEDKEMFQVLENGEVPYQPRLKSNRAGRFTIEEIMKDVLERLARNETGILEPVFISDIVMEYICGFRHYVIENDTRRIPYYIPFDGRLLGLVYATKDFLFYDDSLDMVVMFRTKDGTLVSNNEFAEIGFLQLKDSVEAGETELLPFEPQPGWCARDYTARYFPNAPEVEYHYPVELEKEGEEDPSETLPF